MSYSLKKGTALVGVQDTYYIQEVLGQGSFGITYLATMPIVRTLGTVNVKVAIKEFFMRDINERHDNTVTGGSYSGLYPNYKVKFSREAHNLSKLSHPNIVRVLEFFEANNTVYYVMEYCEGGSLEKLINEHCGVSEKEAITYAKQLCGALDYMHQKGITHLDLKPSNIMLNGQGEVVLIDFGLSKQYDDNGNAETTTSIGIGTPGYAPLEQIAASPVKGIPVTTDIYALGATLFKMLTGVRPPIAGEVFENGLPVEKLKAKHISDNTIACIVKAMSPNKKERFQSVKELWDALAMGIKDEPADKDPSLDDDASEETDYTPEETTPTNQDEDESKTDIEEKPGINDDKPDTKIVTKKPKSRSKAWLWILSILVGAAVGYGVWSFILNKEDKPEEPNSGTVIEPVQDNPIPNYADFTEVVQDVEIDMVYVAEGSFEMGATEEQYGDTLSIDEDEKYTHRVELNGFYIGATEITQKQWRAIMGTDLYSQLELANVKEDCGAGDNFPIYYVNYEEANKFCRRLSRYTGRTYRLPTEAEWEYAARGAHNGRTKFSGSNNLDKVAWHYNNTGVDLEEVAKLQPNNLGLYDMSGNVWEWCSDWYDENYYKNSPTRNPQGPEEGTHRVLRGGSYASNNKTQFRVSYRCLAEPSVRIFAGFRVVCEL